MTETEAEVWLKERGFEKDARGTWECAGIELVFRDGQWAAAVGGWLRRGPTPPSALAAAQEAALESIREIGQAILKAEYFLTNR